MPLVILKSTGIACLMFGALISSTHVSADTITYEAITDFPVIDAGEIPFYVEEARQALAINAARVDYRDRFARAEVVYDGQSGIYQITLVALAEIDGEADYRLLVNGQIVGVASNPEVVDDFSVVRHEFPDITVPAGAVIGVESLANSNGKVPENDEFAFARGRWTMLELSDSGDNAGSETIDLELSASISKQAVQVGEAFDISAVVTNAIDSAVATGIVVSIQLPVESLEMVEGSVCSGTPTGFQCPLPEMAAGESTQLMVTLRPAADLESAPVNLSVSADQPDSNQSDNAIELVLTTGAEGGVGRTEDTESEGSEQEIDAENSEGEGTQAGESMQEQAEVAETMTASSSSSGGGALSLASLLVYSLCGACRRKDA